MHPTKQLSYILPTLSALVDRLEPSQLSAPTPCGKFDVHDVLDHMIVLGGSFAYWFRGEQAPQVMAPAVYGRVPADEFRASMDDLFDAVTSPGAMERPITAPMGVMSGEAFARFVAFDGLVHGWDIASSTGLHYDVPSGVVAAVDEFAREALTEAMRDGDTFKPATTPGAGASRLERLVAFSGRAV